MTLVTEDNYGEVVQLLSRHPRLVADCETTGLRPFHGDKICGVAVRPGGVNHDSFYFPFRHGAGKNLPIPKLRTLLGMMEEKVITNWNTKFDIHFWRQDGMVIRNPMEDVMLAAHLMNENEPNFKLKETANRYLGKGASIEQQKLKDLMETKGYGMGEMWKLPASKVEPYACDDTHLTERLRTFYRQPLKDWGLWAMWKEYNQYMMATADMEAVGLHIDRDLVEQYMEEADVKVEPSRLAMWKMAGYEINPNSPKQVQAWLEVPSSAKEVLEVMLESLEPESQQAQAIRALWEFRGWSKVNGTYYRPYLEMMDEIGILHPSLSLIGTVTGRTACRDPNLQAVARRTEIYKVKDVFTARPGYTLISADYNQAELRLGAHFAKEENLAKALLSGGDVHQATADGLGIPRDFAKRINFGAFYGLAAWSLSKKLHCSEERAAHFLEIYHTGFRAIRPFYRYMHAQANLNGYIRLWTGRVRRYNYTNAETQKALSNFVQGGVGEVMRKVITGMHREPVIPGIRMLLQVHDQVLFEVPTKSVKRALPLISERMMFREFEGMPMTVDVSYGESWGNLTKWRKAA